MFLEIWQNSQENTCARVSFLIKLQTRDQVLHQVLQKIQLDQRPEACNFIKKETLAQVFSCEFCKISKNTFFTEHLLATASALSLFFQTAYISGYGFKSSYSHLNFRFHACFEQGLPWDSDNYRVCIHSETRTWHNKNIL